MAIDSTAKLQLLAEYNRVNGTAFTPTDVDMQKLVLNATTGSFELVPTPGSTNLIKSTPCSFKRIDLASLVGKVSPFLPMGGYVTTNDLIPAINKAMRVDWKTGDIVDEVLTDIFINDTIKITCSGTNLTHSGSMTFTFSNTYAYLTTGTISVVKGQRYSLIAKPQNRSHSDKITIAGVVYPFDNLSGFVYTGETGVFPFTIDSEYCPDTTILANVVTLSKFICWNNSLDLTNTFINSKLLESIGDNVFTGSSEIKGTSGFAGCSKLTTIGRNFFVTPIRAADRLLASCSQLVSIGESDNVGIVHGASTLTETFEGLTRLVKLPSSALRGFVNVDHTTGLFNQLGYSIPNGTVIDADLLDSFVKLRLATNMFQLAKLAAVPVGLFDKLVALTGVSGIFNRASAPSYPNRLFYYSPALADASSVFARAVNPRVGSELFAPGSSVGVSKFFQNAKGVVVDKDAFLGCYLGSAADMFNSAQVSGTLPNFLKNQNRLKTIAGMFNSFTMEFTAENSTLLKDCSAITTIENLFYSATFKNAIPLGYFDSLVNLVNAKAAFQSSKADSSAPAGSVQIPNGLFDKCVMLATLELAFSRMVGVYVMGRVMPPSRTVTSIVSMFEYYKGDLPKNILENGQSVTLASLVLAHSSLTVVDNALIGTLISVVNFDSAFFGISDLTVKSNAFVGLSGIESMSYTFGNQNSSYSKKLVVEAGAFDPLVNLIDASGIVSGTKDLTIPNNLFAKNTKLRKVNYAMSSSKIMKPVSNLFGPNPTFKDLDVTGMLAVTNLYDAVTPGGPSLGIPLDGIADNTLMYSTNQNFTVAQFLALIGFSATNHLDVNKNTADFMSRTEWVKGDRDELIRGLWGVSDASLIPAAKVTETIGTIKLT